MKNVPKQTWLLPLLLGLFFYSCKVPNAPGEVVPDLDLRMGVCATVAGLIAIILITVLPWDRS